MIMYVQESEPMLMEAVNYLQQRQQMISRKRPRSQQTETTSFAAPEFKKSRSAKKSVSFHNFATVLPTASTSSKKDWYSDSDGAKFKANIKRDVLHIATLCKEHRARELDHTEYTTIGIERYCCTHTTRAHAKLLKQQRIKAVIQEQAMQRTLGTHNPEMIREVAEMYSDQARERAVLIAARLVR